MKIKHYAGYGCVNATKVEKKQVIDEYGRKLTKLVIRVSGNHEWGLVRDYAYDLYNWLAKRFDKTIKDYFEMRGNFNYEIINNGYEKVNGLDVEYCVYKFVYPAE